MLTQVAQIVAVTCRRSSYKTFILKKNKNPPPNPLDQTAQHKYQSCLGHDWFSFVGFFFSFPGSKFWPWVVAWVKEGESGLICFNLMNL